MANRDNTGAWLSLDAYSGTGTTIVLAKAEGGFKGRIDRVTTRTVTKERNGNQKMLTFIQHGGLILNVTPKIITFPKTGGSGTVIIETNAETLSAVITSVTNFPAAKIVSATVDGTNVRINNGTQSWLYAMPGDPGRDRTYQIVLEVQMPKNEELRVKNEILTFNGETVQLIQEAAGQYLYLDRNSDIVDGEAGELTLNVFSNVENYKIEIIDCEEYDASLEFQPREIYFDYKGGIERGRVYASAGLVWRIQ